MCRGYRLVAEVKLKNGYLRISVSLFENLYFRNFNKRELLIISLIVRLSYGYQKKTAYIKPKTWFSVCGLYKQDINKILSDLKAKNVIRDLGNNTYSLNKNYDEWAVSYPKNFDEDKLNILKMLQRSSKQNTYEEVSETLTKEGVKNLPESKQNTTEKGSKRLTVSKTLTEKEVNNLPENNDGKQNTYEKVSETLTKEGVKNLPENAENQDGANDITGSKDNKDNKDNTNNIYSFNREEKENIKKIDPYFNNPIIEKFKAEYQKVFKKQRCYLDNIKINKLIEIAADFPEFMENLPEIMAKFAKIKFTDTPATLKWLINDGRWADILNGDYDTYAGVKTTIQKKYNEDNGWTL